MLSCDITFSLNLLYSLPVFYIIFLTIMCHTHGHGKNLMPCPRTHLSVFNPVTYYLILCTQYTNINKFNAFNICLKIIKICSYWYTISVTPKHNYVTPVKSCWVWWLAKTLSLCMSLSVHITVKSVFFLNFLWPAH